MVGGHGRHHSDRLAVVGDTWLGIVWQLFAWTVIGEIIGLALLIAGVADARTGNGSSPLAVLAVVTVLCCWGNYPGAEGARGSGGRTSPSTGLGAGLDGLTIALIADTHYGPIEPVPLVGEDGGRGQRAGPRRGCARRRSRRRLGRATTGSGGTAAGLSRPRLPGSTSPATTSTSPVQLQWVEHMTELGWTVLHNRHVLIERGGAHWPSPAPTT